MSKFTHWTCFHCRKSFQQKPNVQTADPHNTQIHPCPDCHDALYDFGVYFEPPRRQAKKQWAIMEILAKHQYQFQTEGQVFYLNHILLAGTGTSLKTVQERIENARKSQTDKMVTLRLQASKRAKKMHKKNETI